MPTIDWDKWNLGWAVSLPKNQMWAKIRSGKCDAASGEPTYQYESGVDTTTVNPAAADVLAEHRFVSPATGAVVGSEHCFCGWSGPAHADHLTEKFNEFVRPSAKPKRAAKKADG